ncbi:MAG: type I-C CRISPR-associated protein Cas7/Csd2 [Armatimonadota bacterium]
MSRYEICADPARRHDFVLLFDVTDGNPNGDPDAGNLPRVDPETMQGLVTDVCLKRKIRDYVSRARDGNGVGYDVYVKHRGILANEQKRAYQAVNASPQDSAHSGAQAKMCELYYDVRMFGAVMSTGKAPAAEGSKKEVKWNCGQVRGPMQLTFSRSVDPITPLDMSITRVALTNPGDTRKEDADEDEAGSGQMGRKALLPYGLYVGRGFFSPHLGNTKGGTGVTREDLELFWDALQNMWDLDRSASRGMLACQGLYVFSHENPLGNAPAHRLFSRIRARRNDGVAAPRSVEDYAVTVNEADLPAGVTLTRLVG